MAQYLTTTQLDGLFKEVYSDSIKSLLPDNAVLQKIIPFRESEKLGDSYHQPVRLTHSHGVTYNNDGSAFLLNDHVALTMKDANLTGSEMILREAISYKALAASQGGNKKAFASAVQPTLESMTESIAQRLEMALLYGESDTGIGEADTSSNTNSTTTVLTIKTAEWADGIWSGSEGMKIDIYKSSDDSKLTANAEAVVSSVDLDARTVTITGNATDIAAIDTHLGSGDAYIHPYGAKGAQMSGLDKIITNTGSLFGIDAGTYNLWKGSTYSAGSAALSRTKVNAAISKAVVRGLKTDAVMIVNPKGFADLVDGESSLVRYEGPSDKEGMNGFEKLKFRAQNGIVEVMPSNNVKEGEAFIFPKKKVKRVGASDVDFKTPGNGERVFFNLESRAGVELRCYTDQAVFVECPAQCVKITGIVNS